MYDIICLSILIAFLDSLSDGVWPGAHFWLCLVHLAAYSDLEMPT